MFGTRDKIGTPTPSSAAVSAQMRRMPRRDSTGEVRLRSELQRLGLRFRKHLSGLPGTPDVVFTRARIAVFFDGCFWHCCPDHGVLPKSNRAWWKAKLDGNIARDRRNNEALVELGWLPVRVWEHEDLYDAALVIRDLWRSRS
jgi:DNA mismatch endonuclease (patch repair protein)